MVLLETGEPGADNGTNFSFIKTSCVPCPYTLTESADMFIAPRWALCGDVSCGTANVRGATSTDSVCAGMLCGEPAEVVACG